MESLGLAEGLHCGVFAGEDHQRLVLGLPAEARDGAVVAVAVEFAADAEGGLLAGVVGEVADQRDIGDCLDQSEAEGRRGNAERDVVGVGEVLLHQVAAGWFVGPPVNGEEGMNATVGRAVGIADEARLHDRPVGSDEWRQRVAGVAARCGS